MDSTGIMSVYKDDFTWAWQKQAVPASEFIADKSFANRELETWCSVGHSRSATSGSISTKNAHPFVQGDIMLVHNGTLRSTFNLPHPKPETDVDSDVLCYNLAHVDPVDAHEILGKIQGAYALVWFDLRDQTVNFARNSERPFHMGVNTAEDMLVFSSDGHLLNFITDRMIDYTSRPANIWQLGINTHLKYKKGNLIPEVKKVIPFTTAITTHGSGWHTMGMVPTNRTVITPPQDGKSFSGNIGLGHTMQRPQGKAASLGKASICGVIRSIPASHVEMLTSWYQIPPAQSLYFKPASYFPWGTAGKGQIYGQIYHADWDCWFDAYVSDVTVHTLGLYGDIGWTVHPVGVDHTNSDHPHSGITFMCRVFKYHWEGDSAAVESLKTEEKADEDKRRELEADRITDYEEALHEDASQPTYRGPHGLVTKDGWFALTTDGCVMCGGPIFIEDADDVTWIGEMNNQPLCMSCLEHHTQVNDVTN